MLGREFGLAGLANPKFQMGNETGKWPIPSTKILHNGHVDLETMAKSGRPKVRPTHYAL
jgi:hypothetical protein